MKIRDFQYTDLNAVTQLARVSFADDFIAQGISLENFTQQVQLATRGRMIPFKILTTLAGIKWHFFVAEAKNKIVGFGGYTGSKQIELGSLMVHPDFRRQGIGQSLLRERLAHLTKLGIPFVTTTILKSNIASLQNIKKQGFEGFDEFTIFEKSLPLPLHTSPNILSRTFQKKDQEILAHIEKKLSSKKYLKLAGSTLPNYASSVGNQALNKLIGGKTRSIVFENHQDIIGILGVHTSNGQTKGSVYRPLVIDEYLDKLPMMLQEIGKWLYELGKTSIQVTVAHDRKILSNLLKDDGWQETYTWIKSVKYLS
jgi:N-acetylglutamate synthase-like GNAT family acetyltransferase